MNYDSNYVVFYFNEKKSDCMLMAKVLERLEEEYPRIFFCKTLVSEKDNYPLVLFSQAGKNKTYYLHYANSHLAREILERIDDSDDSD